MYENPDGKILQDRNESSCNKHTQRQWKYKFVVKLHGKVLTVRLPRTCSFAFINLSNFTGSSQGNPANVIGIATTLYTARSRFQMPVTVMSFVSCKSSAKALWSTYTPRGELNYLAPLGSEAVFLPRGGGIKPQTESNTTPPSPKTEITNILFYILNLWRRTYCSGLRGCDTREKEIVI